MNDLFSKVLIHCYREIELSVKSVYFQKNII